MTDARGLIQVFYDDVWNRHDKAAIPAILGEEFSFRGSLGRVCRGHAAFAAYLDFIHAALDRYRCSIQEIIAENDKAFARVLFAGLHRGELFGYAPTGRRVEWIGAAVFTFGEGKITDLWVLGDLHGLHRQLAKNAGSFRIRRAGPGDTRAIRDCLEAAFEGYREAYTAEAYRDTVPAPEGIHRRLAEMSVFVAENGKGEVVGTISCTATGGGEGHLRGMAVRPGQHGLGAADLLLEAASDALREVGCARVTLDTTSPLARAMRFYEKNGFRRSGRVGDYFGMPLFQYEKML